MPLADGTVERAPRDLHAVALVLMADIFPTGYFAAFNGFESLGEDEVADATVVVLGCGPVGKLQRPPETPGKKGCLGF